MTIKPGLRRLQQRLQRQLLQQSGLEKEYRKLQRRVYGIYSEGSN